MPFFLVVIMQSTIITLNISRFMFIGFEAEEKLNGSLQFGTDKGVFKIYREPEVMQGEEDDHDHGGSQAKAVQVEGIDIKSFDSAIYRTEPME